MTSKRKYFGKKRRQELNDFERSSLEKYQNRFSDWQKKQIDLLTFSISLLFTFSLAISGFVIKNQKEEEFKNVIFTITL